MSMYQATTGIAFSRRGVRALDRAEAQGTCQLLTHEDAWLVAEMKNMSPAGILVVCPERVEHGPVELMLGTETRVAARVIWSSGTRHGCQFENALTTRQYLKLRAGLQG